MRLEEVETLTPDPPPAGWVRVVSDWQAAQNIGAKQCTLWSLVSALTVFQVMGADVVPSVGAEDGARQAVSSSRPNKGHTPSFLTHPLYPNERRAPESWGWSAESEENQIWSNEDIWIGIIEGHRS